jgi:hypothetical protein
MYNREPSYLFAKGHLTPALDAHIKKSQQKVSEIARDTFLASTDNEIFEHVHSELCVNALAIYEDAKTLKDEETEIEIASRFGDGMIRVPGIRVTVSIPYTGDSNLWDLCASQFYSIFPFGIVRRSRGENDGVLDLVIERRANEAHETIKTELESNIQLIRDYLANQKANIDEANEKLQPLIRQAIRERRDRLGKHEGLVKMLGIPLERNPNAPSPMPITLEKRIVKPLPSTPRGTAVEYGIKDPDYEHILAIIRHEGRTFETTPATYKGMSEYDLRNILLAHLNGHYKGGATGETFRGKGKTDIRIEFENRAAFVAECKVWRGPTEIIEAMDQILGYLTWRDYKCALVIFNKDVAGFSSILEKVPGLLKGHKTFTRDLGHKEVGEWRVMLTPETDKDSRVTMHVFVFNLYSK